MTSEARHTMELTGLATSLAAAGGPARHLVVSVEAPGKPARRIAVGARKLVVGAAGDCDIVLEDPAVSRHHAELLPVRGGLWVHDLDSRNGTRVQGALVKETRVAVGGELQLGTTRLKLLDEGAPRMPASRRERFGGLVGSSMAMREIFTVLELAAPTDATVLVEGPSGTGKELVARALHDHSRRSVSPFIVFDCSTTSRELLQSALFGHKKGSFTGAVSDRPGAFVEAQGGTLFLDEIGELPLDHQAHLLRALESAQVIPVGDDRARKVDVRVVAATNRDLFAMVEEHQFRLDLFHRLAVVHLRLPPLHERLDDLPALIQHFYEGRGVDAGPIVGDNLDKLRNHELPGNVRELRNILERSWVLGGGAGVPFAQLALWLGPQVGLAPTTNTLQVDAALPYKEAKEQLLEAFEARYLPELLARHHGNVSRAALQSGLSRRHLHALLVKHGLRERTAVDEDEG